MTGPSEYATRASLLARLSAGADELAWQEFCRQYGDLVRRVAQRRGLQPADRDDILQDVLVRLTRAMPGFEYDPAKGRFRGYLKTVVLHAITDRFRRKRELLGVSDDAGAEPGVAWPEADEIWEEEWRTYHVTRAMRMIDVEFGEKDRLAFRWYAQDGRSAADVADELDMTVERVYQAKSRILRRLGELVARQVEEEG